MEVDRPKTKVKKTMANEKVRKKAKIQANAGGL